MRLLVTCAIIVDGGAVLAAQRGPGMRLAGQWEFPGGKVEAGETAEACICREILEELGLEVVPLRRGPSAMHPLGTGQELELIPFVCRVVGGSLQLREHAQVQWCVQSDLRDRRWADADVAILDWWESVSGEWLV